MFGFKDDNLCFFGRQNRTWPLFNQFLVKTLNVGIGIKDLKNHKAKVSLQPMMLSRKNGSTLFSRNVTRSRARFKTEL